MEPQDEPSNEIPAQTGNTGSGGVPSTVLLDCAPVVGFPIGRIDPSKLFHVPSRLHEIHVRLTENGNWIELLVSNASVRQLLEDFLPATYGVPRTRRIIHLSLVGGIERIVPLSSLNIPVAQLVPDEDGVRRLAFYADESSVDM